MKSQQQSSHHIRQRIETLRGQAHTLAREFVTATTAGAHQLAKKKAAAYAEADKEVARLSRQLAEADDRLPPHVIAIRRQRLQERTAAVMAVRAAYHGKEGLAKEHAERSVWHREQVQAMESDCHGVAAR